MTASDIEWTESTWNPVVGCTVISPGCTNCYAMRMAGRLEAMGSDKYAETTRKTAGRSVWTGKVKFDETALGAPAGWRKPRRIFVNSMSDLFHEAVAWENIRRVWEVMERANWHTYQILTKRPGRMREVFASKKLPKLPHVWLGTSVESAEYLARLDDLRNVPAAVRFVSFEPLLGSVAEADLTNIDWAIVGGESGPRARPMSLEWVKEIRESCRRDRVAFFFKQWGGTNKKRSGRILDGKTWDAYPVAA